MLHLTCCCSGEDVRWLHVGHGASQLTLMNLHRPRTASQPMAQQLIHLSHSESATMKSAVMEVNVVMSEQAVEWA